MQGLRLNDVCDALLVDLYHLAFVIVTFHLDGQVILYLERIQNVWLLGVWGVEAEMALGQPLWELESYWKCVLASPDLAQGLAIVT